MRIPKTRFTIICRIGLSCRAALPRGEDRLYFYLCGRMRHGTERRGNAPYCEGGLGIILQFRTLAKSLILWPFSCTFAESSTADSALNSVLESPKVEGSRRRPRWKWSPISTQILSEAFKKVRRDGEGRERERMRGEKGRSVIINKVKRVREGQRREGGGEWKLEKGRTRVWHYQPCM